jgi:hypothetical protein
MLDDGNQQFYLYLPSTSNAITFNNTASTFTVQLNRPLELSQNLWECGLTEVFCSKTFDNIVPTRNEIHVGYIAKGVEDEIIIAVPPGYYEDQTVLCEVLNKELERHKLEIKFMFDEKLKRTQIKIYRDLYIYTKQPSLVGVLLGLTDDVKYTITLSPPYQNDPPSNTEETPLSAVIKQLNIALNQRTVNKEQEENLKKQAKNLNDTNKLLIAQQKLYDANKKRLDEVKRQLDIAYTEQIEEFRQRDVRIRNLGPNLQKKELKKLTAQRQKHNTEHNKKIAELNERYAAHSSNVQQMNNEKIKLENDWKEYRTFNSHMLAERKIQNYNIERLRKEKRKLDTKDRIKSNRPTELEISPPKKTKLHYKRLPGLKDLEALNIDKDTKTDIETIIDSNLDIVSPPTKSEESVLPTQKETPPVSPIDKTDNSKKESTDDEQVELTPVSSVVKTDIPKETNNKQEELQPTNLDVKSEETEGESDNKQEQLPDVLDVVVELPKKEPNLPEPVSLITTTPKLPEPAALVTTQPKIPESDTDSQQSKLPESTTLVTTTTKKPEPTLQVLVEVSKKNIELHDLIHKAFYEDPSTNIITVTKQGTTNTIRNMFVYTNIVHYSNIGFAKAPILRIIDIPQSIEFGHQIHQSYTNVQYFPVADDKLITISMALKDSWGVPLQFKQSDETIIILHFRKRL